MVRLNLYNLVFGIINLFNVFNLLSVHIFGLVENEFATLTLNHIKNIKMSSFKSSENIQKKEGGPYRSVSDNQSSSVTLNGLAMKARKIL